MAGLASGLDTFGLVFDDEPVNLNASVDLAERGDELAGLLATF